MADYNSDESREELEQRRDSGDGGNGSPVKRVIAWIAGALVLLIIAGATLFFYYASSAPKISRNELASQNTTTIYDADNKVISRLGAQKREYAKESEIPKPLKDAVVSIEDRRFYKEHGVDFARIMEAAVNNVFHRSSGVQGGSTLTQQLVKLSVFSTAASDRTFKRKAQEAWLAINVERHFSKQEILKFYINKVYMGNGVYGMKTAAQYYYGKDLDQLDLAQMAMLAGIPQAPEDYNPAVKNTKMATSRRDQVLQAMVRAGYVNQKTANAAASEPVTKGLDPSHGNTSQNAVQVKEKVVDAYVKQILGQLEAQGYNPYNDGLQVHTSLDLGAQKHLYDAANDGSVNFQDDQEQVGVAVTNPHNGQVVAMLGGRKTGKSLYGLNRAVQTNRSSGSTAKPLMDYGPAIEYLKWPTFHPVQDTKFYWPGTNAVLHDFDSSYKGTMTMREALVQSRNVPAIRTLQTVGISRATTFLKGLGISQSKPYNLQNGIGLYISPLQEAAAYAAFANGGTYYKPYYITALTTQDGKTKTFNPSGKRAMTRATAYMMTDMLKGVMTDSQGSGTDAHISGVHQAGKTGTTDYPSDSNHSNQVMDSWMTGYTKNYSISVWTGYDQPQKGGIDENNETEAQDLYKTEMEYLDTENHASNWSMPDTVEAVRAGGHRELVIRDSKWALEYGAWTGGSSDGSRSSRGSSATRSSSESSRTTSIFRNSSSSDNNRSTPASNSTTRTERTTNNSNNSNNNNNSGAGNNTGNTGGGSANTNNAGGTQ